MKRFPRVAKAIYSLTVSTVPFLIVGSCYHNPHNSTASNNRTHENNSTDPKGYNYAFTKFQTAQNTVAHNSFMKKLNQTDSTTATTELKTDDQEHIRISLLKNIKDKHGNTIKSDDFGTLWIHNDKEGQTLIARFGDEGAIMSHAEQKNPSIMYLVYNNLPPIKQKPVAIDSAVNDSIQPN